MEILMTVVLMILFILCLLNFLTGFRLNQQTVKTLPRAPFVSVLIPARNEAQNLIHLIPSLLASDYPHFEILVLDDQSTDKTFQTANELFKNSQVQYQVIQGQPWTPELPVSGKNYACHQLSKAATGEILIFCDADVVVSKTALKNTVQLMLQHPTASGVSALAFLKTSGALQKLVLPWIMQIPLMMTLPLRFAWRTSFQSMQMANGQWLALWADRYERVGGHLALAHAVVEDIELSRKLTQKSLGGMIPAFAAEDIFVSMYANWKSMVQGFSKNLILIYGGHPFAFVVILFFLNLIFFWPLFFGFQVAYLFLILGLRFFTSLAFGHSVFRAGLDAVLTWPSLIALNFFAILVLRNHFKKQTHWKGRPIFHSSGGPL